MKFAGGKYGPLQKQFKGKNMGNVPKISVVMSIYNNEKHLNEAASSILKQTFKNFEFIIINDGSTDGTREILESYTDVHCVF